MISKNALGSIPWADVKSEPVSLSECIAARMPCTAATQETREKTADLSVPHFPVSRENCSLMILAPISSASLDVKDGVKPPEMTLTRTWRSNKKKRRAIPKALSLQA